MSTDRLTSANKLALLLWVIAGIAGALFAYKYYFRAFPEASVNFKVSRGESLTRAKQFLSDMGEDVGELSVRNRFQRRRQRENIPGTRNRAGASQPPDVFGIEYLVLGCAIFQVRNRKKSFAYA